MADRHRWEAELLLFCLGRGDVARGFPPRLSRRGSTTLVAEAVRHGVAPLLYRRLMRSAVGVPALTADALTILRDVYVANGLRNRALWLQLSEVLRSLQRAGVTAIVLKGPHLAEFVYRDRAVRPITDLDLLVKPDDVEPAQAALSGLGYAQRRSTPDAVDYARHHHLRPYRRRGAVPVEIHRTLARGVELADDGVWQRARPARLSGASTLVLSPEDTLVQLAVHAAASHGFDVPLLHLCDVAAVLGESPGHLNWTSVASIARGLGVETLVQYTLGAAQATLGAPLPAEALERLAAGEMDQKLIESIQDCILTTDAEELPQMCSQLLNERGFVNRLRLVRRSLSSPHRSRAPHPRRTPARRAAWASYGVRFLRLGFRLGQLVLRQARAGRLRASIRRERARLAVGSWLDRELDGRASDDTPLTDAAAPAVGTW